MSKRKRNLTREIAEELDVLDDVLNTLVELLEDKDILTRKDRKRIEQNIKLKSYRGIQLET